MNTYPVSESEMDYISSLNAQATVRYSSSTFLLGIAISIWVNAAFYQQLTPIAELATYYVAPFLALAAALFASGGVWAQHKRKGEWAKIKAESIPVEAVSPPTQLVVPAAQAAAPP